MSPEEQYPSTEDCGRMKGENPVETCILNGAERINEGWTQIAYISESGSVCAIGGVLVADGISAAVADTRIMGNGEELMRAIDALLSREAKEAIRFLNAAALRRHPECPSTSAWSGPLEWVNQRWERWYDDHFEDTDIMSPVWEMDEDGEPNVKAEVLAIYREAAEDCRKAFATV